MKNKILIIILMILFIILGLLSINNSTTNVDNFIYTLIIKMKCNSITNIMKFISFLFSTIMIIVYCILGIILLKNKRHAIFMSSIMASEALLNNIIKIIIRRPRPSAVALVVEKTYSYPSGHTMAAMILVFVVGYFLKQKFVNKKKFINIMQIILIFLISLSRIYLGAHYFTDIIGAIILSTIILLIVKESKKINNWLKEVKI